MDIEILKINDEITKVKVNEDIMSENVDELKDVLNSLISENKLKIILDFENVDFLSSQVLGAIAVTLKKVRENDGDLRLINLKKRILRIFEVTRLTKIIKIFDNEEECIKSFDEKIDG